MCWLLSVVCCLLFVSCCLLLCVGCWLVICVLFVGRSLSFVVRGLFLLLVVCCVMLDI